MTEQMHPTTAGPPEPAVAAGDSNTVQAAREQASSVGHGAAEAGQQVVVTAKDQAQNVVAEAGDQAKDLLGQARSELIDQAGAQQQRLATGLRALGDELQSMSQHSKQPGIATDLAKQASGRSHDAASWLDSREPGELAQEVRSFARQRPGAFLALAAGAGLLAGRLTRGVKDSTADSDESEASNTTARHGDRPTSRQAAARPVAGVETTGYSVPPAEGSPYGSGYGSPDVSADGR